MPPRRRFFTSIATGFWLASLIVALIGFVSYRSLNQLVEDSKQAAHTQKVLAELENLVSLWKDAETGERGYLLTGSFNYLELYRTASGAVQLKVAQLRKLTTDNPNHCKKERTRSLLHSRRFAGSLEFS